MMQRNIALCIIFCILTCGIYGIYWFICINDDINQLTDEPGPSGGMAFLFCLITFGIYGIYWAYKIGERLDRAKTIRGIYTDSSTPILYLILYIINLSIIVWALAQNEINKLLPPNPYGQNS